MSEKTRDTVNEGKQQRQKTMDKLNLEVGEAYTYRPSQDTGDTGCLKDVAAARKARQRELDKISA